VSSLTDKREESVKIGNMQCTRAWSHECLRLHLAGTSLPVACDSKIGFNPQPLALHRIPTAMRHVLYGTNRPYYPPQID
jgi:hypothetical protein